MKVLSLLEWQLIPRKNKDYMLSYGPQNKVGRFWLIIKGENIEIIVQI